MLAWQARCREQESELAKYKARCEALEAENRELRDKVRKLWTLLAPPPPFPVAPAMKWNPSTAAFRAHAHDALRRVQLKSLHQTYKELGEKNLLINMELAKAAERADDLEAEVW